MSVRGKSPDKGGRLPPRLTGYIQLQAGEWSIVARKDRLEAARAFLGPLPVESLLRLTGAYGARRRSSPRVGRGATVTVDAGDGRRFVVKALRRGGLPSRLRGGLYGRARLLAEMAILEEAHRRGLPTAAPAFGAVGRTREGREAAVLATEEIPDAVNLTHRLSSPALSPPERRSRRAALRAAGAAVRHAHDLGLNHADLNTGNILVGGARHAESAWVIDLGVSKLGAPLASGRRASNLVRLLRSAEKHLGREPGRLRDAVAFLRGYLAGSAERALAREEGAAETVPRATISPARGRTEARVDAASAPAPTMGDRRIFRRDLLRAIRRRVSLLALHRLGWFLTSRA